MSKPGEGGIAEERTPEELKADKAAAFEQDPDRFLDMKEVVIVAAKRNGTIGIIMNPATRADFYMAKAKLDHNIDRQLFHMDNMDAKANKSPIVIPGHNRMKNFLNGGGGKVG